MENSNILVSTWGYEQTNVTFYRIIKRTAKTVVLQKLRSKVRYTQYGYEAVPTEEYAREKPIRRKAIPYGSGVAAEIEYYEFASPWDGRPVEGNCNY